MTPWLDEHIETFIRPVLKRLPEPNPQDYHVRTFDKRNLRALFAIWHEAKRLAKGRPILLAGRDVFLLEALAKSEGFPTIFRPDISKLVATSKVVKENYSDCFLIDTGYEGTVPISLDVKDFRLIYYSPYVIIDKDLVLKYQLFPHCRPICPVKSIASYLEGVPKYWGPGRVELGKIVQKVTTDMTIFERAAQVTMHVLRNYPKTRQPRFKMVSYGRHL